MTNMIPKKIAIINDMAGFGRCSMAVALPVISACKVQACPVPTSIFSNHTGFPTHYMKDLTEFMNPYLEGWNQLHLKFDGILCGFLSSIPQMKYINSYLDSSLHNTVSPIIIIDPVMGDHGKAYKTITPDFCLHMKQFIQKASILTPNITEACLLTDTPYKDSQWSETDLIQISEKLHSMGPQKIVITGIKDEIQFCNFIYENNMTYSNYATPIAGASRPGTGDIFASILSALSVRGFNFTTSVQIAADFIATSIKASSDANIPTAEGVIFEMFLDNLTKL